MISESWQTRFDGLDRLYGRGSLNRLAKSHVAVIGIGGVGSWSAEALARSGIGQLTLIDLDDVCISNTNRQLHALSSTIGRPKVEAMAERIALINPECTVHAVQDFLTASTLASLLALGFDHIIDAIDSLNNKVCLLSHCYQVKQPVVTVGGAGGRIDLSKIDICDLSQTTNDGLLRRVRKQMRKDGLVTLDTPSYGIPAVYSRERPRFLAKNGQICFEGSQTDRQRLNCESGYGTASFVTGAYGFAAAGRVVSDLLELSLAE